MTLRNSLPKSLSAFAAWLPLHPATGAHADSDVGVRHQVARYCDFLHLENPLSSEPLVNQEARSRAVSAYRAYLEMFNAGATPIPSILASLDRFYVFLGLGPAGHPAR